MNAFIVGFCTCWFLVKLFEWFPRKSTKRKLTKEDFGPYANDPGLEEYMKEQEGD